MYQRLFNSHKNEVYQDKIIIVML